MNNIPLMFLGFSQVSRVALFGNGPVMPFRELLFGVSSGVPGFYVPFAPSQTWLNTHCAGSSGILTQRTRVEKMGRPTARMQHTLLA